MNKTLLAIILTAALLMSPGLSKAHAAALKCSNVLLDAANPSAWQASSLAQILQEVWQQALNGKQTTFNEAVHRGTADRPPYLPEGYKLIRGLGGGFEGAAYEVANRDGTHLVLKVFDRTDGPEVITRTVKELRAYAGHGVPTVKVQRYNLKNMYMLSELVNGFDVSMIVDERMFSLEVREQIKAMYRNFVQNHSDYISENWPGKKNVVLDVYTGQFIIVDPR